ncbi:MAG: hypothetical protein EXS00_03605 [Phycisphaerales bacterium]|nr:hypothetical protein [Phycisphaerales bacterium]
MHSLCYARDVGEVTEVVVHIEFTDSDGDLCKATGQLRVLVSGPGTPGVERLLDLSDKTANHDAFQRATSTYRMTVSIPRVSTDAVVTIEAKLVDGERSLSDQRRISVRTQT